MISVEHKFPQFEHLLNDKWVVSVYFRELPDGPWKKSIQTGRRIRGRFVPDGEPVIEEVGKVTPK